MTKHKLLEILTSIIGVETDDIEMSDSLRDDLHMNSVDLAELVEKLSVEGFEGMDISEVDTVEELIEELHLEEEV